MMCGVCARAADPPGSIGSPDGVDRLLARWAYAGIPRALVLDLKLRAARSAAVPLAHGLAGLVQAMGCRAATLTWVPGRTHDTRVRGFDHAELIARGLADLLGLPLQPLLGRRTATADQAGLSRSARHSNLIGAFRSGPTAGWVGLVDDVVTSGATAHACAVALKEAGCQGVEVLAACRA